MQDPGAPTPGTESHWQGKRGQAEEPRMKAPPRSRETQDAP